MRKFEPPFTIDDQTGDALILRDRSGVALAYVYGDDRPTGDLKKLSRAEAEGVAKALALGLDLVSAKRRGP